MTDNSITEIEKTFIPMSAERKAAFVSEYVGKQFGRLTVLDIVGSDPFRRTATAKCKCECGNVRFFAVTDIRRLHAKSCGCRTAVGMKTHGEAGSKNKKATTEYLAWQTMRGMNNKQMKASGGTAQSCICPRWTDIRIGYVNFLEDMGRRPANSMMKRCDNTKPYSKDNCYWRLNKTTKESRMTDLQKQDAELDKTHEWTVS